MDAPDFLHARMSEIIASEMELVSCKRYWAVLLGLAPFRDGNQWCVCLGDDIQIGVVGFGESPMEAVIDFDRAWYSKEPLSTLDPRAREGEEKP